MSLQWITMCTQILDRLSWIVSPALERNLGAWLLSKSYRWTIKDTGAEATVIPYKLYKEITNKPLHKIQQPLKGWLAPKPIHPKGSVWGFQFNIGVMNLTFCIVVLFIFLVVVVVFIIHWFNIIQHNITIHFTITERQKKRQNSKQNNKQTKKQKNAKYEIIIVRVC